MASPPPLRSIATIPDGAIPDGAPSPAPRPPAGPEDEDALLRLACAGAQGGPLRRLLEAHPSPAAALAAGPPAWSAAGLGADVQAAVARPDPGRLRAARAWRERPGRRLLPWGDPDYPALLRLAPSPPGLLFLSGDPALAWRPQVAIVGSRAPTAAGLRHATGFALALAEAGLVVTSGLASGVDAAAHRAALAAGGATIAVIGCGPDRAFPAGHAGLQATLEREGLLVAEDPPGTPPDAWRFPRRNRVIAGLALGTLVVEAAQRSGALITGRLAAEAGREVFALPGAIDNLKARGCHALIRQGAALVESPGEVMEALAEAARRAAGALRGGPGAGPGATAGAAASPSARPPPADPRQRRLWAPLADGPLPAEALAARAGLTMGEASSILLLMELEGHVIADGGRYLRKP